MRGGSSGSLTVGRVSGAGTNGHPVETCDPTARQATAWLCTVRLGSLELASSPARRVGIPEPLLARNCGRSRRRTAARCWRRRRRRLKVQGLRTGCARPSTAPAPAPCDPVPPHTPQRDARTAVDCASNGDIGDSGQGEWGTLRE